MLEDRDIVSAKITFPTTEPEGVERGRPIWSIGANVAGPALLLSITFQLFPVDRLALEAGVLPPGPGAIGGWAGARVNAIRLGPISWYLGAFAHASMAGGASDTPGAEKTRGVFAGGPRTGIEYVFPSGRHELLAEFDLVHAPNVFVGPPRRDWNTWGGVGYAYLF